MLPLACLFVLMVHCSTETSSDAENTAGSSSGGIAGNGGSDTSNGQLGAGRHCSNLGSDLPVCDACMAAKCCDEATACARGTDCEQVHLCYENCRMKPDCAFSCEDLPGARDASIYNACQRHECKDECQIVTSGVCGSGLSFGNKDFDACLTTKCCTQLSECTQNDVDSQSCIDCIQAGSGELCDNFLACYQSSDCVYCVDDGQCPLDEDCRCPDCVTEPSCTGKCEDNSVCSEGEPCSCDDCQGAPQCPLVIYSACSKRRRNSVPRFPVVP